MFILLYYIIIIILFARNKAYVTVLVNKEMIHVVEFVGDLQVEN